MPKITRRDFIRIASLMGGASLFAGCSLFEKETGVPEYIKGAPSVDAIETTLGVDTRYSVCSLCSGNCGISCRIVQGVLAKIGGNPYHPVSKNDPLPFDTPLDKAAKIGASVCAIGSSGIQTLYDPFRILKPLKRIGPRGSRKWKAISWAQAVDEISQGGNLFGEGNVEGLKTIKTSGEGLTLLAGRIDWGALLFLEKFVSAFPGTSFARTNEILLEAKERQTVESIFGTGYGTLDADYRNVAFLLDFGSTPLDSGRPLVSIARQIADARLKSPCMSWVVVDPRASTSSSKADHWIPIVPGTDDMFALAIAKALFEKHGDALKQRDDELGKITEKYSFEELASRCGVKSQIVLKIAEMMAQAGPKCAALCGSGILAQPNGEQTARLILTLNLMVGSAPGSGGLLSLNDDILKHLRVSVLGQNAPKLESVPLPPENRGLIMWQADPVYYGPPKAAKILSDKKANPLFVAIDRTIIESAAFADYILPDTSYLERWDICSLPPSCAKPGFGVRSPVVGGLDPQSGLYFPLLPDNLVMEDILIQLGASVGLDEFLPDKNGKRPNSWQFYEKVFSSAANYVDRQYAGLGQVSRHQVDKIRERGGIFPSSEVNAVSIQPKAVKTKNQEAWFISPQPNKKDTKDLILVAYTLPFHRFPGSGVNSWLLEILPENKLVINPADASERKIKQGDDLFIQTFDGNFSARIKAQVSPGIRPGVVAIAKGFGYKGSGASVNIIDELKSSEDKPRSAGINPGEFSSQFPVRIKVSKA
ncbi:MAG: molybdopterin-dependent oxidoreductase [Desulfomonilaceae bacterium]